MIFRTKLDGLATRNTAGSRRSIWDTCKKHRIVKSVNGMIEWNQRLHKNSTPYQEHRSNTIPK
jgi:hypothetical protein